MPRQAALTRPGKRPDILALQRMRSILALGTEPKSWRQCHRCSGLAARLRAPANRSMASRASAFQITGHRRQAQCLRQRRGEEQCPPARWHSATARSSGPAQPSGRRSPRPSFRIGSDIVCAALAGGRSLGIGHGLLQLSQR
jgi:hypothetical protein